MNVTTEQYIENSKRFQGRLRAKQCTNYMHILHGIDNRDAFIFKHISSMDFPYFPRVYNYDETSGELIVKRIVGGETLAYKYGTCFDMVPEDISEQVRTIVNDLYEHGLRYKAISPYNFMVDKNNKVYLIDAKFIDFVNLNTIGSVKDDFVERFINGLDEWNTEYL